MKYPEQGIILTLDQIYERWYWLTGGSTEKITFGGYCDNEKFWGYLIW